MRRPSLKPPPDAGDAIAAEVLSPAEAHALNARTRARLLPAMPPFEFDLSPGEYARLRAIGRKARERIREHRRAQRAAKVAKRAGRLPDPKPDPIDAAIERAYRRELELARRTPERLWTAAMRQAVERAKAKP